MRTSPEREPGSVVVSDVDGALHRKDLFGLAVRTLTQQGWIRQHRDVSDDPIGAMVRSYDVMFTGKPEDIMYEAFPAIRRAAASAFPFVEPVITAAKESGKEFILVSKAPQQLVDIFGRCLGIEVCYGSRLLTSNGTLTGEVEVLDKQPIVDEIHEHYGTIHASMGDTVHDLPLLEAALYPMGVGHDYPLQGGIHHYVHGKRLDWPVVDVDTDRRMWRCAGLVTPDFIPGPRDAFGCMSDEIGIYDVLQTLGLNPH